MRTMFRNGTAPVSIILSLIRTASSQNFCFTENNTSNAHETLIKLFQAFHANIKHQKPFTADFAVKATFPHYLKTAISVLQLTTAWRRDPLSRPNGITDGEAYTAAALFFTANCLGKIRQRAGQFSRVYGDALATWRAVPADNVSSSPIKVTLPFLQRQLQRLCIDKTSTEEFLFDQGSAHLWLQAITDIVDRILKRSDAGDIIQVIKETDALHRFLKILNADQACNLWRLPSLEASLDFQFTKSSSRKEGEEDAEDGFEEGCIEAQAEHSLPALPHAKVFTRAVDAICAWTTATQVLTSRRYIGPKTAIKLQLIKLPRESLKQLSASSLLLRWMRTSQHVDYNSLKDWLKKLDVKRTYLDAGAEHCEAGLMAGLIAGAQLRDREELEGAFDDSRIEWEGSSASTAIGVGKKCCPVCALLAHTILTKRAIRFELPGQHAEYRAWVPPRFTPLDILLAMEGQLLEKVGEMMQQQNLHTSRPSSPASDSNPVGLLTDDIPDES
ncbi:hypothetical protein FB451DRAFT_266341 [Mycena latifolia]|nr:hypothetical protein FB451DRAFT_266341 [Mycena latifolia]